jgi:acetolactate synthase-1/2/3 large subunit
MGDGSMLMHGMELQTAVRYKIPLIVVVINNEALGNVYWRYWEEWKEKAAANKIAKIAPRQNWATFAKGFNAGGIRVDNPRDLIMAYRKAFRFTRKEKKPFVIDVICNKKYETPNSEKKFAAQIPKTLTGLGLALRQASTMKEIPFIWHS